MAIENRILTAIDFIEYNLKEAISTEDIAFECNMSKRTLQRRFVELTGETIKSYIRSRRLTEASKKLTNSKMSVLDTAIDYQFDSYEGFSRAFKRMYAMSPKHYRHVGSNLNALDKFQINQIDIENYCQKGPILPTIVKMPKKTFAGIRTLQANYALTSKENSGVCRYALTELNSLKEEFQHLKSDFEWSITYRSDATLKFHFLDKVYAFETKGNNLLPKSVYSISTPENLYAVFNHNVKYTRNELISKAFNWLRESCFHLGDSPCLYRQSLLQENPAKLYLPISNFQIKKYQWWQGYKSLVN